MISYSVGKVLKISGQHYLSRNELRSSNLKLRFGMNEALNGKVPCSLKIDSGFFLIF